jgi:hypothetical protein
LQQAQQHLHEQLCQGALLRDVADGAEHSLSGLLMLQLDLLRYHLLEAAAHAIRHGSAVPPLPLEAPEFPKKPLEIL